jgi:hypothetical protein
MALASCPARQGQQRSFRKIRQDLSWVLAGSPGAQPGMHRVGVLLTRQCMEVDLQAMRAGCTLLLMTGTAQRWWPGPAVMLHP